MEKMNKARPLFSRNALIKMGFSYTPMPNRTMAYHHTDKYFLCVGEKSSVCICIYQNFNLGSVGRQMDFVSTDVELVMGHMESVDIYPKELFELRRLIASLKAVL